MPKAVEWTSQLTLRKVNDIIASKEEIRGKHYYINPALVEILSY